MDFHWVLSQPRCTVFQISFPENDHYVCYPVIFTVKLQYPVIFDCVCWGLVDYAVREILEGVAKSCHASNVFTS